VEKALIQDLVPSQNQAPMRVARNGARERRGAKYTCLLAATVSSVLFRSAA
jgi:hypothetical protein